MTKILLIEDEDMLRGEIAEWLTLEGFEVVTASDGVEGANAAIVHLPDVILCDIMMPRLDGFEVMLHVRANTLTQLTPFIFITARVSHEDIRSGMSFGADDYITKPFSRVELLKSIETQLGKRAAQKRELAREVKSWRHAVEQEREQNLLRARMVAMFAHDFRNPLTVIMSSLALLRDYADRMDEQRRQTHLNRATAGVRQLMQMLDDMLFIAQAESNSFEVKLEKLDIGQFLEQVVNEFRAVDDEKHHVHFEANWTQTIMTDPRLLRQIAANLITNAIKYSSIGSNVRVILDVLDLHWVLIIQDEGIGIPQADQKRLFSAFQRGSNVEDIAGTGLGLAIVKQAAEMLDGEVELESEEGKGTTIEVRVPIHTNS